MEKTRQSYFEFSTAQIVRTKFNSMNGMRTIFRVRIVNFLVFSWLIVFEISPCSLRLRTIKPKKLGFFCLFLVIVIEKLKLTELVGNITKGEKSNSHLRTTSKVIFKNIFFLKTLATSLKESAKFQDL